MATFLTIAYMTNRKDPRIQWFFDSLYRELSGDYGQVKVVVVDYYAQPADAWTDGDVEQRQAAFSALARGPFKHVPPKPTVWQGRYRLAKINYFAAANARNTALCLAPDGYIVFVDDLSVLLPGWLGQVYDCVSRGEIAQGTYSKVLNLQIKDGEVVNYVFHPHGRDSRLEHAPKGDGPHKSGGGWSFGCSIAMPVEALLQVNGYDEDCDSMGFEDVICGIMLERQGYQLMFCPKMRTLESEELHFVEVPFARIIKKLKDPNSLYPDSSHAILDWVLKGRRIMAPNYQNMRDTRSKVLAGEPFPMVRVPEHDWRDSQPIREMDQTR